MLTTYFSASSRRTVSDEAPPVSATNSSIAYSISNTQNASSSTTTTDNDTAMLRRKSMRAESTNQGYSRGAKFYNAFAEAHKKQNMMISGSLRPLLSMVISRFSLRILQSTVLMRLEPKMGTTLSQMCLPSTSLTLLTASLVRLLLLG